MCVFYRPDGRKTGTVTFILIMHALCTFDRLFRLRTKKKKTNFPNSLTSIIQRWCICYGRSHL